jgi:protein-S-isoprenylcysteine O-methyltransferase Ste14
MDVLQHPAADRALAVIAFAPFGILIWDSLRNWPLSLESLLLVLELSVLAMTMAARRPPVRVTRNPFFWLLALVTTYWSFPTIALYESGVPLVPHAVSISVAVLGFAVSIWARLSLGRNIGFVPAERCIVTTGIYAYVRHPIYSGLFISIVAVDIASFSWRNIALDLTWVSLWIIKTFAEERFLRTSDEYAHYMKRVRWRWFPAIA